VSGSSALRPDRWVAQDAVAVLSNLDPPAASRISMFIRARLPAK